MSKRRQVLKNYIEKARQRVDFSTSSEDEQHYDSDKDPEYQYPQAVPGPSTSFRVTSVGPKPYKRRRVEPSSEQHNLERAQSSTQQEPKAASSIQDQPAECDQISDLDSDNAIQCDDTNAIDENLQEVLHNMAIEEELEENVDDDLEQTVPETERQMWNEYRGVHKDFDFTGDSGLQMQLSPEITPYQTFCKIVDNEVIELIVEETNRYANQCLLLGERNLYSRLRNWKATNGTEIMKFLILIIWMGLVPIGSIKDYWSTKSLIYNFDLPKRLLSRDRFQALLANLHFSNNQNIQAGDRLAKIKNLISLLQQKFQELFIPGPDMVIDETLVPFRGRLIFRQYIPNKAHKYGIKLFKLCSSEGYTYSVKVYSGKSATGIREHGLAQNVCLELCQNLLDQGRTLTVDNFYTSYELAKDLLEKKTHLVGTIRANKKNIPKEVLNAKLKKGELISREDENGIVVLKWRDTRDVRILSTKHAPTLVNVERGGIIREADHEEEIGEEQLEEREEGEQERGQRGQGNRRLKKKPVAVVAYNKSKCGIDLSDQMKSYANINRKGVKWYRKLALEMLLGMSVVNSWVIYKKVHGQNIPIRVFREKLVTEAYHMLMGTPDGPELGPNAHELIDRRDEGGKLIRRRCKPCYALLQNEKGRDYARKKCKTVGSYCPLCPDQPHYCRTCFNQHHKILLH